MARPPPPTPKLKRKPATLFHTYIGTIWSVEQSWLQRLREGAITIKDQQFLVEKLDPNLAKLFSSKVNAFQAEMFENDKTSIFKNEDTIGMALQAALKQTTKNDVSLGLIVENLKQTRYLREQLAYHQYMPIVYVANAVLVLYCLVSKVLQKVKEYQRKKQLQRAVIMRQEREILLQQLRG